ncbi:MAG: nucleotidyltransferase domain-containing protein [Candidatus Moraniibacteriota bacterium]
MEKIGQDKIEEIAKKYNLQLLLLFGSQVSGKTHPMSDFDFGYIGEKKLNYKERSALANELSKLVKFSAVEVIDLKNGSPFLLKEIIKNNQVFFEENGAYADFYTTATRIYFDAEPIFKLQEIIYSNVINKYRKQYAK